MRLRVLSDLHLEMGPIELPRVDAHVVVLAGDVGVKTRGLEWAARQFPDMPVIYVPGNHEYYGAAIPKLTDKLRQAAAGTHVHVLEQEQVTLGGVTFLGCTLWADLALFGDPRIGAIDAGAQMTDYRRIRVTPGYRRLRPADTQRIHAACRMWLEQRLADRPPGPLVVVTHHAPSPRSLESATASEPVSAAYASNLETLVERSGAALWVHGHIHRAADYWIGTTRVVCNPRGYPEERGTGFEPGLAIEV
jgi:Icc-related predicted phosphoesterase